MEQRIETEERIGEAFPGGAEGAAEGEALGSQPVPESANVADFGAGAWEGGPAEPADASGFGEAPGEAGMPGEEALPPEPVPAPTEPREPSPEERARRIAEDLLSARLPEGFDVDAAMGDGAFLDLLTEFPAAAAARVYAAERKAEMAPRQVAALLKARQSVPEPIRPRQAVSPEPDYRGMPSEEFFALKERLFGAEY